MTLESSSPETSATHHQVDAIRWHHKTVYWFVIGSYLLSGAIGFGSEVWQASSGQIPAARELVVGVNLANIGLALFSIMGSIAATRLVVFLVVIAAFLAVLAFLGTSLTTGSLDWTAAVGTTLIALIAYGFVQPGTRKYAYALIYPKLFSSEQDA